MAPTNSPFISVAIAVFLVVGHAAVEIEAKLNKPANENRNSNESLVQYIASVWGSIRVPLFTAIAVAIAIAWRRKTNRVKKQSAAAIERLRTQVAPTVPASPKAFVGAAPAARAKSVMVFDPIREDAAREETVESEGLDYTQRREEAKERKMAAAAAAAAAASTSVNDVDADKKAKKAKKIPKSSAEECSKGADCCKVESTTSTAQEECCKSSPSESADACCNDNEGDACCGGSAKSAKSNPPGKEADKTVEAAHTTRVRVMFGTQTGNAKRMALDFAHTLKSSSEIDAEIVDLKEYDPEDLLDERRSVCVIVSSTYTDGAASDGTKYFHDWLDDVAHDFRIARSHLAGIRYALFGLGNSLYGDNFCASTKRMEGWMREVGAVAVVETGYGDENVANSKNGGLEGDFAAWKIGAIAAVVHAVAGGESSTVSGGDAHADGSAPEDEENEPVYETTSDEDDGDGPASEGEMVDVEDLGKVVGRSQGASSNNGPKGPRVRRKNNKGDAAEGSQKSEGDKKEVPEMITPALRSALTKQGYKLIGSHSGVKLCRWTKSMLRGRGGCYKHTFYGIESHRCMETTPSLACANKCVFCWRHHTNPVGTEWKWKMDDAVTVVDGAMERHYAMIREMKGVPGVLPERLDEGMSIKHCALSLVGEPIMYPQINEFVDLLHRRRISSFLVTNAQFPDQMRTLQPVTQLYVSVDAATPDALKKIDRPLFKDYWQRFIDSLDALGEKGQRTVYRLTLVKAWNTEELTNYAALVSRGRPSFIEIKGVTFCGDSKASSLTMENVPWHTEVVSFVQQLADQLPDYELCCEHEHSHCLLLARKEFKIDGRWHTWIDYDRFHTLAQAHKETGATFTTMDYLAPTPDWALFGSTEHGFNPVDSRVLRKGKKDVSGC
eukprot:Opistho-2@32385